MYPGDTAVPDDMRNFRQASPDRPFAHADKKSEVLHGDEFPLSNELEPFANGHWSRDVSRLLVVTDDANSCGARDAPVVARFIAGDTYGGTR